jgi:arginase family enzyme
MSWVDDFALFLKPIALQLTEREYKPSQLGAFLDIHDQTGLPDLSEVELVLVGVKEGRRCGTSAYADAPDALRAKLYELFIHSAATRKIADLGNIDAGQELFDTDEAVKTVVKSLVDKGICVVLLGGTQDLTLATYQAYEVLDTTVNMTLIDSKIDLGEFRDDLNPNNYLSKIVLHDPGFLFNLSVLGYQTYLTDPYALEIFEKLFFDAHRLGSVVDDISRAEPVIRNADMVSFDIQAIRNASAPGTFQPNGFGGVDACAMARYAGLSDKTSSVGFYNYNPAADRGDQTASLVAQMIWYFIDGFGQRIRENPMLNKKQFLEFNVQTPGGKDEIQFYKSKRTDKWWMRVPYSGGNSGRLGRHHLVPCSYNDYELASSGDVPELWWRTYQKLG